MIEKCEACRKNVVSVIYTDSNPEMPFRVCSPCLNRMEHRTLRPREYFHLVSIHGHVYELSDHFYEDDGTATQPQKPVKHDDSLRFPELPGLKNDLEGLLDYATVKWWYPKEASVLLRVFPAKELLRQLDHRIKRNRNLIERYLEIAAEVLAKDAGAWVAYHFHQYSGVDQLIFANACATCLEPTRGFEMIAGAMNALSSKELSQYIDFFGYFNSPLVLRWLEDHRDKITQVTTGFGVVCAANQFDWLIAKRWLESGRPLSLVALDALVQCGTTATKQNRSLRLRENPPRLINPDSIDVMNHALDSYLEEDKVHRTKVTIAAIKKDWVDILKTRGE